MLANLLLFRLRAYFKFICLIAHLILIAIIAVNIIVIVAFKIRRAIPLFDQIEPQGV